MLVSKFGISKMTLGGPISGVRLALFGHSSLLLAQCLRSLDVVPAKFNTFLDFGSIVADKLKNLSKYGENRYKVATYVSA